MRAKTQSDAKSHSQPSSSHEQSRGLGVVRSQPTRRPTMNHDFQYDEEKEQTLCAVCGVSEFNQDQLCAKPMATKINTPPPEPKIHVDRQRAVVLEQLRAEVLAERQATLLDDITAYKKFKGSSISQLEHTVLKNLIHFVQRRHQQLEQEQIAAQKASA